MSTKEEIGNLILQHYYNAFMTYLNDQNEQSLRENLTLLYREPSSLVFEGQEQIEIQNENGPSQTYPLVGPAAIVEKLVKQAGAQFEPKTCDTLIGLGNTVSMMVTGVTILPGEQNTINFTEFFQIADDNGNFYVNNQILRLNFDI